jgi:hypothetical protein
MISREAQAQKMDSLTLDEKFTILRDFLAMYKETGNALEGDLRCIDPLDGIVQLNDLILCYDNNKLDGSVESEDKQSLPALLDLIHSFYCEEFFFSLWKYVLITKGFEQNSNLFYDINNILFHGNKIVSNFFFSLNGLHSFSPIPVEFSFAGFVCRIISSFIRACSEYLKLVPLISQEEEEDRSLLPVEINRFFDFCDSFLSKQFVLFLFRSAEQSSDDVELIRWSYQELVAVSRHLIFSLSNPLFVLSLLEICFQIDRKKHYQLFNHPNSSTDRSNGNSLQSFPMEMVLFLFRRFQQLIHQQMNKNPNPNNSNESTFEENEADSSSLEQFQWVVEKIFLRFPSFSLSPVLLQTLFSSSSSSSSSISSQSSPPLFRTEEVLFLLVSLLQLWGSPLFHNQGSLFLFQSYSQLILSILGTIVTREHLSFPVREVTTTTITIARGKRESQQQEQLEEEITLEMMLVKSISAGLECSLPLVRRDTMKVALKYSSLVGIPLEFDELREMEEKEQEKLTMGRSVATEQKQLATKSAADQKNNRNNSDKNGDRNSSDDVDEEDEITGYFLSKENDSILQTADGSNNHNKLNGRSGSSNRKPKVIYLRECIDCKRTILCLILL